MRGNIKNYHLYFRNELLRILKKSKKILETFKSFHQSIKIAHHWEAMGIPAKATFNMMSCLVCPSRNYILNGSSQNVPIVGKTRGKWWAVVKSKSIAEKELEKRMFRLHSKHI